MHSPGEKSGEVEQRVWGGARNGGSRPVPDPTVLTTQQLTNAIIAVREILETRLNGMDKAIELLQKVTDKFPILVHGEVHQLKELHGEKFDSIRTQFVERDTRTEQTSRDSKVAVDAALQAAKEAVGEQNKSNSLAIAKSEASTTKQLDQIQIAISGMVKTIDDKIVGLKELINGVDGRVSVTSAALNNRSAGHADAWGWIVGGVGIVVGIASVIGWFVKLVK